MFRNILLPTDGSSLSTRGVRAGLRLAKSLGARATAVYVVAPYVPPMYGEGMLYGSAYSPEAYRKAAQQQAEKVLTSVEKDARGAGVRCKTLFVTDPRPWKGLLKAARREQCDAISMASHGRGGLGALLLGSETTKVLAHSKLPVVVTR